MNDQSQLAGIEPVAAVFAARGAWPRVLALICSVVALVLPALTNSLGGTLGAASVLQVAIPAVIAPLAIGAALLPPAFPTGAKYVRLADLVATVIAAIAAGFVIVAMLSV